MDPRQAETGQLGPTGYPASYTTRGDIPANPHLCVSTDARVCTTTHPIIRGRAARHIALERAETAGRKLGFNRLETNARRRLTRPRLSHHVWSPGGVEILSTAYAYGSHAPSSQLTIPRIVLELGISKAPLSDAGRAFNTRLTIAFVRRLPPVSCAILRACDSSITLFSSVI